jgi:hypothetical protein
MSDTSKSTIKIKKKTLAISAAAREIPVNPNMPATMATIIKYGESLVNIVWRGQLALMKLKFKAAQANLLDSMAAPPAKGFMASPWLSLSDWATGPPCPLPLPSILSLPWSQALNAMKVALRIITN